MNINEITIDKSFQLWSRILNGKKRKDISIKLKDGINVIASPNGSGKTTIMEALKDISIKGKESVPGVTLSVSKNKEGKNKVLFFGIDEMSPDRQMREITPYDSDGHSKLAYWFNKQAKSHGQSNFEIIEDILVLSESCSLLWVDEPELALDMEKMIDLIKMLDKIKDKTQIIVISHHPFFVLNKDFNVVELDGGKKYQNESRKAFKYLNCGI